MQNESKSTRHNTDDNRLPYWHAAWERAIHRFCRSYETAKGLQRGTTPLSQIQSFHQQWYQNKGYRLRANDVVECPVCKADYEEALQSGEVWPKGCPDPIRERAKNFGIRVLRGAETSLTPSRV